MSVSCKDKTKAPYCTENPGNCQSVLAAKDFFLFKVGSWWVYEEETTHEHDSVYEYNNTDGYDFDMHVRSALTDYEYHFWPTYINAGACNSTGVVQSKCLFVNRSKYRPNDYIGESECFFVNYKVGDFETTGSDLSFCPDNKIIVLNIDNNFQLNGLNFEKTVTIKELCSFIEGAQPTKHFYSKSIGLVRKELLDSNQVWNLVSYHIEP